MPEPKEETVAEVLAEWWAHANRSGAGAQRDFLRRLEPAHAREIAEKDLEIGRREHEAMEQATRCVEKDSTIEALKAEVARLKEEIVGWVGYKRGIDEALNSGDGSYRP
jgi:hypothetical protein